MKTLRVKVLADYRQLKLKEEMRKAMHSLRSLRRNPKGERLVCFKFQQRCPGIVFDVGGVVSGSVSDSVSELGAHGNERTSRFGSSQCSGDAGCYRVSTNIKTMAINVPVAWSPLDRDVEPEHHR